MKALSRLALAMMVIVSSPASASAEIRAIRFAQLWDGTRLVKNATVLIDGARIVEVRTDAPQRAAEVIDLRRYTGLPGLIDLHTHSTYYWDRAPGTRPRGERRLPAVTVFLAQDNARRTLEPGVTTIRDLNDTADGLGKKVAIHSYGPSGVRDAVRAGADSVEHGADVDDDTLADMARRGTVWVPTVDHNRYYIDAKDEYGFAPGSVAALKNYIDRNFDAVGRAVKAGVRLGMGSDV